MFGSQILDVAIGLVFIFLMLSLVVTALNELVAAWLKRRSNTLWTGVVRLVGDDGFAEKLYAHPLVQAISQSPDARPSYIPSRTFVLALLDGLTEIGTPPPATDREVVAAIAALPPTQKHLATTLTVLLHDAGHDIEEFKKMLEQWFEGSMERVSGWYKRETQWILLVMAAVLTIWANCDTVVVANTLWRDPAVRSSLVAQATSYANQHQQDASEPEPPPEDPSDKLGQAMKSLDALGIPLGWRDADNPQGRQDPFPTTLAAIWLALRKHALGWLLTTLAVSLGAPFWFDMLNKVVSIRSAGKAPEESQKSPKRTPEPLEPGGKPAAD